jgi:hypothetical protein
MKSRMIVFASLVGLALASSHALADGNKNKGFTVTPFTFIGAPGDCGPTAGSNIVTSSWLTGLGLPDDGSSNTAPANTDPHNGLLLSKNGLTSDCSAAGASVTKVKGITLTELGFDVRNGSHCSGGAPRFNVDASDGFHFVGSCTNGTLTPAPQDPTAWTRARFDPTNPAQFFPPLTPGATIKSISIIFDEGTDTAGGMAGLAVIDNIDINGVLVPSGPSNPGNGKGDEGGGKPHREGGD